MVCMYILETAKFQLRWKCLVVRGRTQSIQNSKLNQAVSRMFKREAMGSSRFSVLSGDSSTSSRLDGE